MKVGFFSPLPPARTGVADYSAALLPYLRELGEVEVGVPGDVALYHIGNNSLHREIYRRALEHPGVVVLHDAVLHHLMLGRLDAGAYEEEFVYNYGESSRELGRRLWRERARSGGDIRYFEHPMVKRIATASRAIIVHNPAAAGIVRRHVPGARVAEIPHLFVGEKRGQPANFACAVATESAIFPSEIGSCRHFSGFSSASTFKVGTFGHQRETKRLAVLLRAFQRAVESGADARLLVAGEFVSTVFEKSLNLNQPWIERTGFLPEADFWRYAAATDVCVNLRYPSAGETSGIGVRMMGIGKCVIFTAGPEIASFPETACLRVDPGPREEDALAGYIRWLAADRGAAAEIGRRAAEHVAREHAPEKVARQYWEVLSRS